VPSTLDNDVRVFVYRFMVDNQRPPMPIEIGTALGTGSAEVEAALKRLAEAHVLVLAPGTPYIWLAAPLSGLPSPFPVTVAGGVQYYGICIWDALGVIAMLGEEGSVTSLCPDCGEELTLRVRGGEIEPQDYVVHYAIPAAHWWDDIGYNCSKMLLFLSAEHRDTWLAARSLRQGATLSVVKQWDLARVWYGNRMSPEWRRRTPEEAQAVFESLGLTGPFWNLSP